jgi:hypothetical protein
MHACCHPEERNTNEPMCSSKRKKQKEHNCYEESERTGHGVCAEFSGDQQLDVSSTTTTNTHGTRNTREPGRTNKPPRSRSTHEDDELRSRDLNPLSTACHRLFKAADFCCFSDFLFWFLCLFFISLHHPLLFLFRRSHGPVPRRARCSTLVAHTHLSLHALLLESRATSLASLLCCWSHAMQNSTKVRRHFLVFVRTDLGGKIHTASCDRNRG